MKILRNIITMVSLLVYTSVYGQINPLGSMYFQNQYLMNPAMVGTSERLSITGALKAQWTAIEGAPVMESITVNYSGPKKKVGLGLNFYDEKAGFLKRTSIKGTYAYHIGLGKLGRHFIDLGLSAGITDESIDFNKFTGDLDDVTIYNFNNRKNNFDGDFGFACRINRLTIQGSLPNLKRFLKRDLLRNVTDRNLFFSSASYEFRLNSLAISTIEPIFVYRAVQNYKDIMDFGANIKLSNNKLVFSAIYHSSNSVAIGVGTIYQDKLSILCIYTTNTAALGSHSNGEFEIALKLKISKN
ncbi:MAG: PorP/SprF family type IX secretion system membrane protein [Sphingobacteriaceae bacterium]|nr:PorP/SprF family type IX secretion system membrane protein [Sphingobacteriaceae bacterium]